MTDPNWSEIQDAFAQPFAPDEIDWKPQSTNKDKTRAMAVAYMDARNVMERLDATVGAANWSDRYRVLDAKHVECELSIYGVTKCDVGETNEGGFADPVKSAFSDAFKRAAVKWGIGRYLYALPTQWVACEARGKSVVLKETPRLPAWALPDGYQQPRQPQQASGNGQQEAPDEGDEVDERQRLIPSVRYKASNLPSCVMQAHPRYDNTKAATAALAKVGKKMGFDRIPGGADEDSQDQREALYIATLSYADLRAAGMDGEQALDTVVKAQAA